MTIRMIDNEGTDKEICKFDATYHEAEKVLQKMIRKVLGNIKEMLYAILTTMIHDDVIQHVHYVVKLTLRIRRQRSVCLVLIHSRILLKPCESDYDSIVILKNDE